MLRVVSTVKSTRGTKLGGKRSLLESLAERNLSFLITKIKITEKSDFAKNNSSGFGQKTGRSKSAHSCK